MRLLLLCVLHGRHGLPAGVLDDPAGILHAAAQRRNAGLKALVDGCQANEPCPCCPSTTSPGVGRWAKRSSPTCFAWNVELSGCACVAIVSPRLIENEKLTSAKRTFWVGQTVRCIFTFLSREDEPRIEVRGELVASSIRPKVMLPRIRYRA